ncbi:calmodulin-like protein 4 [Crassostrea virginica]|uniref:Calmodulin-like protein 4 n=1 Tax=Crassostrea virginica TaxID=6565 RepID=A0A8B8C4V8_CRAVI|nr:calmodulin-like protein 4 [Crassostrea virginica]
MAKFFSQTDIDKFKECFFFHARRGHIGSEQELSLIMRSLGCSPTAQEVSRYYSKYATDQKIEFASFLEAMHDHSQVENPEKELLNAFKSHDRERRGYVNASEVQHIMLSMGERLSRQEVDSIFREMGVQPGGQIRYNDFVKSLLTPVPDY